MIICYFYESSIIQNKYYKLKHFSWFNLIYKKTN